jgi:oxygen-dependent protoporphyrinogen oxidase
MPRIAVIGGGAAGLAAAWKLVTSGAEVTLFERAEHLGGRARSEELDSCIVDTGAQLFASGFSTLRRTAREVGAESLLLRSPGRDAVYRDGRIHPIVYGSVSSMVTSSALPALLKLKLARYVPFLMRHARQLDASDPVAAGGDALDTGSVADWGREELGQDFVELLAYPLLGAYYGCAPERMSVALYHALAKAGLDVTVYGVRGGTGALLQSIADAAKARHADIRTGVEVTSVRVAGAGVRLEYGGETAEFDAAIVALPAPLVTTMTELPPPVADWLKRVEFAPAAVLALVVNRSINADFFGLSLLRSEISELVAICVQAKKANGLVPSDRGLLICLGSPQANASLVEDSEGAAERMIAAVERVLPGTRERITRAKLYRHQLGYPVFYPGYLKHLRRFPADSLPRGIALAGDYLVGPTVEGALRSGERAAEAVLRQKP